MFVSVRHIFSNFLVNQFRRITDVLDDRETEAGV